MKHAPSTIAVMLLLFLGAQFIGLSIVQAYATNEALLPITPPEQENKSLAFIPIILAVAIGTGLVLILAKLKLFGVWKIWYSLSIFVALYYALTPLLEALIGSFYTTPLLIICLVLVILKLKWQNIVYQNISELFVYGGIIALFVPLFNVIAAAVLLLIMSGYDVYAVRYSKHMVKLAQFQLQQKSFAGLQLSEYNEEIPQPPQKTNQNSASAGAAILGGGDIAFPLLFSATLLQAGWPMLYAMTVSVGAAIGLLILFKMTKPGKFYPALPFVSAGAMGAATILTLAIALF